MPIQVFGQVFIQVFGQVFVQVFVQVFGQDLQNIHQQLHPLVLQTHFSSEARQKNVEKMEAIKKLEEIKRDTFSSLRGT